MFPHKNLNFSLRTTDKISFFFNLNGDFSYKNRFFSKIHDFVPKMRFCPQSTKIPYSLDKKSLFGAREPAKPLVLSVKPRRPPNAKPYHYPGKPAAEKSKTRATILHLKGRPSPEPLPGRQENAAARKRFLEKRLSPRRVPLPRVEGKCP